LFLIIKNMKLYATTTSERASKGQGGNENLWIKLEVEHDNGEREVFGEYNLSRQENYYVLSEFSENATSEIKSLEIKGNKQKSENEYYYDLSTPALERYYHSLTSENASEKHIAQVEKELESRN